MVSSVKKGKAAEHIFLAKCLMRDLDCFSAVTEDGKVDMIVGPRRVRCQVKALHPTKGVASLRKVGCNSKSNVKVHHYTSADVDFFVMVDLNTFETFVVPIGFIEGFRSMVSAQRLRTEGFSEAFEQLAG